MAPRDGDDVTALVHSLQVHQAELELQNHELVTTNEELRRSNDALAVARDRYHALHELAPVPLVTLDAGGTVIDVNGAGEALLRTPRAGLVGRRFPLFVADPGRSALAAALRGLFAGDRVRGLELVLVAEDEPPIDVLIDAVLIHEADDDHDERMARALLAFVDVTARMRAEQTHRLESLGTLAGGVAHDFNNLMTVALGGVEYVLRKLAADSPLVVPLIEVQQAALHAGELAHQMLAYSGQSSAPARPVDLAALLHALEPLARASAKEIPLMITVAGALPWVVADEGQLREVVLNLVINAAEASRGRPGAIAITARADTLTAAAIESLPHPGQLAAGLHVVLEVHDQGVGMDAATQARIFEPYFSTKFTGRGLGLAVVHGIVRGHRGAVTITSELDRGTTFRVYLPAVAPVAVAPRAAALDDAAWRSTATVLLVDDEANVRRAFARILLGFGLVVLTAADGVEAVEVFREASAGIDLVLLDLTMPRMGGVAAARAIHALRADVPIVLVTGYGEIPADAADLFAAALPKPFRLDRVRSLLQRLLPAPRSA
jgi:signal transduction histidine kinase/CheY-like chemotaxis protein